MGPLTRETKHHMLELVSGGKENVDPQRPTGKHQRLVRGRVATETAERLLTIVRHLLSQRICSRLEGEGGREGGREGGSAGSDSLHHAS